MATILIVEDDQIILDTLADILSLNDHEVEKAKNGQVALELLREKSSPDLILLDLMMPVMGGKEFLEKLQSDSNEDIKSIPVVVLSAVQGAAQERVPTGAKEFVKKPVKMKDLLEVVDKYCKSS